MTTPSDFEHELAERLLRLAEDCVARLDRRPDEVFRAFVGAALALATRYDTHENIGFQLRAVAQLLSEHGDYAEGTVQ